jgi:low affinity Fe/Cu permease
MVLTVMIGLFGLLYFTIQYNVITTTVAIILALCCFFLSFIFGKKITTKLYSIEKLIHKINEIPNVYTEKNIILGICRYLVFRINTTFVLSF